MLRPFVALLLLLIFATLPVAAAPATQPAASTQPADADVDPLERRVTLEVENARLDRVLKELVIDRSIDLVVNWNALQAVGVVQDTPITLRLRDRPLETVLDHVLRQAGAGSFDPIGHAVIDGVIEVSTRAELARSVETRVYNIRSLLADPPEFRRAPRLAGAGGEPPVALRLPDTDPTVTWNEGSSRDAIVDQVRTLVTTTVSDAAYWIEGQFALQELNGNLIVKATPDAHDDVLGLLRQLHHIQRRQLAVDARLVRMSLAEFDRLRGELGETAPVLNAEAAERVERLTAGGEGGRGMRVLATGSLVLIDGQRGYMLTGEHAVAAQPLTNLLDRNQLREEGRRPEDFEPEDDPPFDLNRALSGPSGGRSHSSAARVSIFGGLRDLPKWIMLGEPVVPLPIMASREALLIDVASAGGHEFGRISMTLRADAITYTQAPPARVKGRDESEWEVHTYLARWRSTVDLPDGGGVLLSGSNAGDPEGTPAATSQATVLFVRARWINEKVKPYLSDDPVD